MKLFEGRQLTCVRGTRRIFADLDFALSAGGALLLTGPNGSGKSSLLRLMSGLLKPASGGLFWGGIALAEQPDLLRGRLHYVGHLEAVKPVLTAAENLAFWAGLQSAATGAVEPALACFGLEAQSNLPGRLLSAGQKRRLALARLRASPAELWLLDEPGVGLDQDSLQRLGHEIAQHRAEGGCVVLSTHGALPVEAAETLALEDYAAPLELDYAW